jgi:hypothetical protein
MGARTWPEDWEAQRAGVGCIACADGRTDDIGHGVRFFAGNVSDGYLMRSPKLPGHSVVTLLKAAIGQAAGRG